MRKSLYSIGTLLILTACNQELEITPASDLNELYKYPEPKIFAVKTGWFQEAQCKDLEKWAQTNLPLSKHEYIFVKDDEDITFKGNPYLEKEYDIMVFEYLICEMEGDNKRCYICRPDRKKGK